MGVRFCTGERSVLIQCALTTKPYKCRQPAFVQKRAVGQYIL